MKGASSASCAVCRWILRDTAVPPRTVTTPLPDVLELLRTGDAELIGRLVFSSNYVFLTELGQEGVRAVYKPVRGERPLWDFPAGTLAAREAAAFVVAAELGWDIVPPTVLREDLPLGAGSLQLFIEHDPERHLFVLVHERQARELVVFAAFDIIINNADRKAGHVLEGPDGQLWGVDHGLSFNVEPKLRTVIWGFAGEPVPEQVAQDVEALLDRWDQVKTRLDGLLSADEIEETRARAARLLHAGTFPSPEGPFHMPWPLI